MRDPRIIPAIGEPMPAFWLEKRTVAFLTDGLGEPIGTAFFVALRDPLAGRDCVYLATAAHNVNGYETDTFVRLTRRGGGVDDFPAHRWVNHPNTDIDVAVSPFADPMRVAFDFEAFRVFLPGASPAGFKGDWEPGDGEDVYYIGLLGDVAEMGRNNVPMVRSGTLGAWAQPGVPWRDAASKRDPKVRGTAATAHILDVHSHAGFSGSPCLAFEGGHQGEYGIGPEEHYSIEETVRGAFTRRDKLALIGLISGHFPHREKAFTSDGKEIEVYINAGVAVVTPLTHLREVLALDELQDDREARRKSGKKDGYVSDSKRPGPEPERLQSDESLDELAKRVMDAGKPDDRDSEDE